MIKLLIIYLFLSILTRGLLQFCLSCGFLLIFISRLCILYLSLIQVIQILKDTQVFKVSLNPFAQLRVI